MENQPINTTTETHPYPTWFIYVVCILFWPVATGIIGYKSLNALGKHYTAKVIIKASIIFTIICWIISFSWQKSLYSIAWMMSIVFAWIVGKTQSGYIKSWHLNHPDWKYENILTGTLWGLLWVILYLSPTILYMGYLYFFPCPSWYESIWDYCFPIQR